MRKNKVKAFSKKPELYLEKLLTAQILACTKKQVSLAGQFDHMSVFSHPINTAHRSLIQTFKESKTDFAAVGSLWPNYMVARRLGLVQMIFFFPSVQWYLLYLHRDKKKHDFLVTLPMLPLLALFTVFSVWEDPQGTFLTMKRIGVGDGFASSVVSMTEILNPIFQDLVKHFVYV